MKREYVWNITAISTPGQEVRKMIGDFPSNLAIRRRLSAAVDAIRDRVGLTDNRIKICSKIHKASGGWFHKNHIRITAGKIPASEGGRK